MRDFITVEREANKIRQLRQTFSGTFLLVEGSSDKTFYERFVNKLACQLVTTSGKPSSKQRAIQILEILSKSNFQGVLAIVDADFDRLQTIQDNNPNLLRTDTHDLETMLIKSPALEKVLAELGSEDKITKFNQDIREFLLSVAVLIGYLRWISLSDELNLTFEGITFSKFINEQTLQIDIIKMIREVKNKSQAFSLKDTDLQQKITNYKSTNNDPWEACCGHDLVEVLSLSLRKVLGSNKAADVESNRLEICLRLAYEEVYFHKTQLYSDILTWESNNQPFQVLQNGIS